MLLIPLITQSTWIVYLSGFTCNRSSPTEPASENGSKSERARCKQCVGNIARLHCFCFCSADITPTVYWLDYRKVNFVSLFKGRGKLIYKLLKVKSETERNLGQVRYKEIFNMWHVPLIILMVSWTQFRHCNLYWKVNMHGKDGIILIIES